MAAYRLVEPVCPFVRTGNHDRLLHSIPVVGILYLFQNFAPLDRLHIGKRHVEQRDVDDPRFEHTTYVRGIKQNARSTLLPYDVIEQNGFGRTVNAHLLRIECRTVVVAHRRQLCGISHNDQTAIRPLPDVSDQILEQLPRSENRPFGRVVRQHRGLVDNKDRRPLLIIIERERCHLAGQRLLPVNLLMDRICLGSGIATHHLRRTSRWRQQYRSYAKLGKRTHQCGNQRRLSRSGISVQDENPVLRLSGKELTQSVDGVFLRGSWLERKILVNLGGDMIC